MARGICLLVARSLFRQEGGDAGSGIRVVQVADELVALGGQLRAEAGARRIGHQLLHACQHVGCPGVEPGGQVFFAVSGSEVAGTVAMIPYEDDAFELTD